ncbi:MAG: amidohydrolase family protein, partial [Candidatus Omnitrophica bacterium]|nr:amidohydrolase family protein [Candidatus Omnitrophota bacterium]
ASEDVAVARDIELARLTGGRIHFCHLSTARAIELVRRAKAEVVRVTADVTPHHLTLTDEAVEGYNTSCKMNPPLRSQADLKALRQGLRDHIVDCIATDHAPHSAEDKMAEFDEAPFGTIGLETALAVALTELYYGEKFPLSEIVRWMSSNPAQILNLGPAFGRITKGQMANLTLVDINKTWVVAPGEIVSKSRNSCFMNRELKGKVLATVCAGKLWRYGI